MHSDAPLSVTLQCLHAAASHLGHAAEHQGLGLGDLRVDRVGLVGRELISAGRAAVGGGGEGHVAVEAVAQAAGGRRKEGASQVSTAASVSYLTC